MTSEELSNVEIGSSHGIDASMPLLECPLLHNNHLGWNFQLRVDILKIPFKWLAPEVPPNFQSIFNATHECSKIRNYSLELSLLSLDGFLTPQTGQIWRVEL